MLTKDEKIAIEHYTNCSYTINEALRNKSEMCQVDSRTVKTLDRLLNNHRSVNKVYFGIPLSAIDQSDVMQPITFDSYISASRSFDVALGFANRYKNKHQGDQKVAVVICVDLNGKVPSKNLGVYSSHPSEEEVLIGRGLTFYPVEVSCIPTGEDPYILIRGEFH